MRNESKRIAHKRVQFVRGTSSLVALFFAGSLAVTLLGGSSTAAAAYPVFALSDNRLLAHGMRHDGLAVAMGHPGFVKYTRFARPTMPWKLGVTFDGRKVALPLIPVVSLELPLTARQASADALYLRL